MPVALGIIFGFLVSRMISGLVVCLLVGLVGWLVFGWANILGCFGVLVAWMVLSVPCWFHTYFVHYGYWLVISLSGVRLVDESVCWYFVCWLLGLLVVCMLPVCRYVCIIGQSVSRSFCRSVGQSVGRPGCLVVCQSVVMTGLSYCWHTGMSVCRLGSRAIGQLVIDHRQPVGRMSCLFVSLFRSVCWSVCVSVSLSSHRLVFSSVFFYWPVCLSVVPLVSRSVGLLVGRSVCPSVVSYTHVGVGQN